MIHFKTDSEIGKEAFESPSLLKSTIVHEYAHFLLDRAPNDNGEFRFLFDGEGLNGYANQIFNAGRLHIKPSHIITNEYNPLWNNWQIGFFKWGYLAPCRFNNGVNIRQYSF